MTETPGWEDVYGTTDAADERDAQIAALRLRALVNADRATAAQVAAEGYRQRAERAEAKVARVKALADDLEREGRRLDRRTNPDRRVVSFGVSHRLRAVLSVAEPADGSGHPDGTESASDGRTEASTGTSDEGVGR